MSARTYAAEEVWELQGKVEVEDDGMSRGKAEVRIASSRDALRYTYISLRYTHTCKRGRARAGVRDLNGHSRVSPFLATTYPS